ncbi:MAG: hypothetical protein ACOCY6_05415 [Halodesulfurarchaeum sp.]
MQLASNRTPAGVDWFVLTVDLLVLALGPVILGVVQLFAPESFQSLLTYDSAAVSFHGLFGHWAVHYTRQHLLDNVIGYAVIVWTAYLLAWNAGERRWFRLSALTILVVVPAVSISASALAFDAIDPALSYTSRGASGVVAALAGLLYALSLGFVRRLTDLRGTISLGGTILILVMTGLLVQIGSPESVVVGGILGATGLVLILDTGLRLRGRRLADIRWRTGLVVLVVGYAVTALLYAVFLSLFPPDPFAGSTITNVFSHATGFVLGTVITVWGHRYWTGDSWS